MKFKLIIVQELQLLPKDSLAEKHKQEHKRIITSSKFIDKLNIIYRAAFLGPCCKFTSFDVFY
jgi:hypothetical protein